MALGEKAKHAIGAAGGVVTVAQGLYALTVSVDGKPIREKLEPATVRILGIPVFERDAALNRYWFGFIRRGRSKVAKEAIAKAEVQAAKRGD